MRREDGIPSGFFAPSFIIASSPAMIGRTAPQQVARRLRNQVVDGSLWAKAW
jgi:hypothetical protein